MRLIKLLLSILLLACFYACDSKPYPHTMQMADSLVNTFPDSALTLLNQLKEEIKNEPESTQMYYQLLTVKAKDKAYIPHTSDSTIKQVVSYYEKQKDKKHLPEAYYYTGRVYHDLNDAPQALDYYQKAINNATENTDYRLMTLIYYQSGMLYLYQHIFDKSLDAFKTAYHYAILAENNVLIIYNLREIGRAFTGLNNVDSTLYYYEKAEKTAENNNNTYLVGIINQEMAGIYTQLKQYSKAYSAIQKSLCTSKRSIPAYYATLADLFYETEKTDSARFYYSELCYIGNYYQKRDGYKGLSKISRQEGKLLETLSFIDKYHEYTDSINKTMNAEAVHKVNALYNYQLREKENYRLRNIAQKQEIWIKTLLYSTFGLLLIIIAVGIIYRLQKKQKEMRAERQQDKLKRMADKQYYNSQQYMAINKQRITVLREKLLDAESKKNELEKNIHEAEKYLLELTNKEIETRQKIQILSEKAFKESQIYKDFYHVAGMPNSEKISEKVKLSQMDWEEITIALNNTYDNFTQRLQDLYPKISEHELRICILLKISIPPLGIAKLATRSKQAITSSRKKLYEKVHNKPGTPDLWDEFIKNF